MVRKINWGLVFLFSLMILVLYGNHLSTGEYDRITNQSFNATVYLETSVSQKRTIEALKEISDEEDLTIAKIIADAGGNTEIYFYSKNDPYAETLLSARRPVDGETAGEILTFYSRELHVRPLEELENRGVEGRYSLCSPDAVDSTSLVERVNQKYAGMLKLHANSNLPNTFRAPIESLKQNYGIVFIAILFLMLLTAFFYDFKSQRKEIAIKRLLGYDTKSIFSGMVTRRILFPVFFFAFLAELAAILIFTVNGTMNGITMLGFFLWRSLQCLIPCTLGLTAVLALICLCNVVFGSPNLHIVSDIKGREAAGQGLSMVVKTGSTLAVVVCFGIITISWSFFSDQSDGVQRWEDTKNYAFLNVYTPEDVRSSKAEEAKFEQTHRQIWSFLNEKNGILFWQRTPKLNQEPVLIGEREVEIPFVYLNDNYLAANPVLDAEGNAVRFPEKGNCDVLSILIPEKYKPFENQLAPLLHRQHVYDKFISEDIHREWISGEKNAVDLSEANMGNPSIKEVYYYIADDQALFTYDMGDSFLMGGILAVVDEDNMGLNVYTPSIAGSEGIKVKFEDMDQLKRETRELFSHLGWGAVDTDFTSVYQQKADEVRLYKMMLSYSVAVFTLSFLFLILSLLFRVEIYHMNHKKKTAIKKCLGFGFFERNKSLLIGLLIQDVMITAAALALGLFLSRRFVELQVIQPIAAISILILIFDLFTAAFFIRNRENRYIATALKGE